MSAMAFVSNFPPSMMNNAHKAEGLHNRCCIERRSLHDHKIYFRFHSRTHTLLQPSELLCATNDNECRKNCSRDGRQKPILGKRLRLVRIWSFGVLCSVNASLHDIPKCVQFSSETIITENYVTRRRFRFAFVCLLACKNIEPDMIWFI